MKRLALMIFTAMICGMMFISCSIEKADEGQTLIGTADTKYIRSGTYLGMSNEFGEYDYFVLKNGRERDNYINRMKLGLNARGLNWEFTGGPQLALALNEYNDIFFRDYNLVMILLTEGSGGNWHEVERADVKKNVLNILIKRYPWGITADMAYWHILIPIRKHYFNGNRIDVSIVNVDFE